MFSVVLSAREPSKDKAEIGQEVLPLSGPPLVEEASPRKAQASLVQQHIGMVLKRASESALARLEMAYDFYPVTHPVHRYVDSLARETLGADYAKVKIYITKGWRELQACALADGSIVISSKAIQRAEYREALQALLLHEAEHIVQEHARTRLTGMCQEDPETVREWMSTVLRAIGMARIHEYASDLGWIVKAADSRGINPYGCIYLFSQLSEESKGVGLTHGSTLDRSLNTEALFYVFPLRTLARSLTPLPPDVVATITTDLSVHTYRLIPNLFKQQSPQELAQHDAERARFLASIRTRDLLLMYKALDEHSLTQKARDAQTRLRVSLDRRVEDEILAPLSSEPELGALWRRAVCILGEVSHDLYRRGEEDFKAQFPTEKEILRAPSLLRALCAEERDLPTFSADPTTLGELLTHSFYSAIRFSEHPSSNAAEAVVGFIKDLSEALEEFSLRYCTLPVHGAYMSQRLFDYVGTLAKGASREVWEGFETARPRAGYLRVLSEQEEQEAVKIVNGLSLRVRDFTPSHYEKRRGSINRFRQLCGNSADRDPVDTISAVLATYNLLKSQKVGKADGGELIPGYLPYVVAELAEELIARRHGPDFRDAYVGACWAALEQPVIGSTTSWFRNLHLWRHERFKNSQAFIAGVGESFARCFLSQPKQWLMRPCDATALRSFVDGYSRFYESRHFIDEEHDYPILYRYFKSARNVSEVEVLLNEAREAGIEVLPLVERSAGFLAQLTHQYVRALTEQARSKELPQKIAILIPFIESPRYKSAAIGFYFTEIMKGATFEKKVALLSQGIEEGGFQTKALTDLIEYEMRSKDDFALLRKILWNHVDTLVKAPPEKSGVAALVSCFEVRSRISAQRVMERLPGIIGGDDTSLKALAIDTVYSPSIGFSTNGLGLLQRAGVVYEELLNLSDVERRFVLRRLLTGPFGMISNPEQRKPFLESLFNLVVSDDLAQPGTAKTSEPASPTFFSELFADLSEIAHQIKTWQPLYFALESHLLPYTFRRSSSEESWKVYAMRELGHTEDTLPTWMADSRTLQGVRRELPARSEIPWIETEYFNELLNLELAALFKKVGYFTPVVKWEKKRELAFALDVCQRAGALGVRFLQLLPQFVELPASYASAFSRVYDAVEGQSKMSALMTLEADWAGFWDDIGEVTPGRCGGGSMASVFRLIPHDSPLHTVLKGRELVAKVQNPNLAFHLEQTAALLREAITALCTLKPKYRVALTVIEEVQDWITAELAYDRFMQEDPIFKEQNDGFTYPGSRYVITVPQSFVVPPTADAVDANRILLEEFIPADKLTEEFSELEQRGHDMRDVISLISRNYLTQLRHGLVHSDVSIGNFLLRRGKRAGERTEVMIIDRNFYLAIKPELAAWMQPFLTALEFLASPTEEYLSKLSLYEPHDLTADRRAEAGAGLAELRELILRGTFAAGPMLSAIRKLTALTPEVADLVEYLIDPRTVSLVPAHAFVTRAAKIAKCTLDTREVARLSEEWGSAKNRLFTAGEWTGIIGALQQISAALGSAGAKTEVVTRVLDVASILLEPAAAQLDRVLRLSITKSTAIKHRPQLLKEWQEIRDNVMRGDASGIGAFLQSLRQRGIRFPLEVTLICKNLVALHHMARKAGLSRGLADALTYTTKHAPAHACPP